LLHFLERHSRDAGMVDTVHTSLRLVPRNHWHTPRIAGAPDEKGWSGHSGRRRWDPIRRPSPSHIHREEKCEALTFCSLPGQPPRRDGPPEFLQFTCDLDNPSSAIHSSAIRCE
jgi:hypothetical protein